MSKGTDFAAYYDKYGDGRNPMVALIREYVLPYWGLFSVAIVIHIGYSVIRVVPPYLIGVAVDLVSRGSEGFSLLFVPTSVLPTSERAQFILVTGLLVTTIALTAVLRGANWVSWEYLQKNSNHDARTDVFDATQRLGVEFFERERIGEVISVHSDLRFDPILREFVRPILQWASVIFGMLVVMALLHWQLTLVILIILSPTILIADRFDEKVDKQYPEVRRADAALTARIRNSISGIVAVKATANETKETDRVTEMSETARDREWDVSKSQAKYKPLANVFTDFAPVVVLLVGGWWAVFGPPVEVLAPLSVGTLITFFFYAQQFAGWVGNVTDFVDTYREHDSAASRILGIMSIPSSVPEPEKPIELDDVKGRVSYDDVTFSYPETEEPVLRDLNLDIDPGEFVGLVGPTGAGKTTVIKLLVRFYDPDEGSITIDGHDLMDLDLTALRREIGYVSQEPFLFDDSVRDNIAYGDLDADETMIIEAAKQANAHEFILELEDGYDTRIGEEGVKLSGGQRQRIAIARALIKDPGILILDEATSHVDSATEAVIQDSLERVTADRTTIAIAHSLSTVRDADLLITLKDGEIVETGTHQELVEAGGLYETLWSTHLGEIETGASSGGGSR